MQANLESRNPIFSFLNQEFFDLKKIYVLKLKTGWPKKKSYVGKFAVEIFLKWRFQCNTYVLKPFQPSIYCTRAIITRGLYIFYPIFHCGLYCRAVSVTDNLCTKPGNSSIFGSKIRGL